MNLADIVNPAQPIPGTPERRWGYRPEVRAGYLRMTHREYMEFPAISASLLKCPTLSEMWSLLTAPMKDTPALAVGTLVDMAITGGMDSILDQFAVVTVPINPATDEEYGRDTKKAKAAYKETTQANPGKFIVSSAEWKVIRQELDDCVTAFRESPVCVAAIEGCLFQTTGIMWREDLGAWVKWRPDALPLRSRNEAGYVICDIKTSRRHVLDFKRDAWEFGYFDQGVWYKECHEEALRKLGTLLRVENTDYIVIAKPDDGRRPRRAMARVVRVPMNPETNLLIKPAYGRLFPDDGMGRAQMFLGGLREHLAANPDPADGAAIRRIWHAYELDERPTVMCETPK